jgi:hypothetical protein
MPTACVLYAGSEFAQSARYVKQHLEAVRFSVTVQDIGHSISLGDIRVPAGGCDVAMWLSHGGWDGPMIFESSQIDPEQPELWAELKVFMGRYMKKNGILIVHACHSAGSNKWQVADGYSTDRWVHEVARDMDVYTAGVEGSTSSANYMFAVDFLKYSLQGTRNRQASRVYRPGGELVRPWPGWLNVQR